MNQLNLFDDERAETDSERKERELREAFERFHEANPAVYEWLRNESLSLVRNGRRRFGIWTLWGVLRWRTLKTHGDKYKLNNNHTPFYARLLMDTEPELAGLFQLRERK